jgi:hypothetical protein
MSVFDEARAIEAAETQPAPAPNPYPQGSEQWYWYNDQLGQAAPPPASSGAFAGLPPAGAAPPAPEAKPTYHGSVLPFSRDSDGHVYFDPLGAGPVGGMVEAAKLPGRVMSGEVQLPKTWDPAANDPNAKPALGQILNMAGTYGTGINPMVRSGDRAIPGAAMRPKDLTLAKTPTAAELKAEGGRQIEGFKSMGINYDPKYIGTTLASQIEGALVKEGVFPEHAPGLYASIKRLRDYVPRSNDPSATINVEPSNLIAIRKSIANNFGKQGEDQHGVGVAHGLFADFLERPPAQAVLAGTPAFQGAYGPELYARGRANYAAGMRDEELGAIQRESRLRARAANSGQNVDNTVRSKVTSAVLNAKRTKGFTPEEITQLENVPEGTLPRNAARVTGNLLGGGGGLGAAISAGLGTTAGHFAGLGDLSWLLGPAVPAVGAAIKRWGGKGTVEALEEARQATRQRSPLFKEQLPGQDLVPDVVAGRDRIARALSMMATQGGQGVPLTPDAPRRIIIDTPSSVEERP